MSKHRQYSHRSTLFAMMLVAMLSGSQVYAACEKESKQHSYQGKVPATIQFVNQTTEAVQVYWLDYQGQRVLYQTLPPDTEYVQSTYLTHPWVLTQGDEERCVGIVYPDAKPKQVVVKQGRLLSKSLPSLAE